MDFKKKNNMSAPKEKLARVRETQTQPPQKSPHRAASRRILAAAVLIVLLLAVWGISALAGALLKVKSLNVSGESPYTNEKIISASGLAVGMKINKIDKKSVEQTIGRDLTYLSEVRVKTGMFGGVKIVVKADEAAYYSEIAGEFYALSSDFRLLEKAFSPLGFESEGLIYILLPKIKIAILSEYLSFYDMDTEYIMDFMNDLEAAGFIGKVRSVDLSDRYAVEFEYEKFTVKIGTCREVGDKLKRVLLMEKEESLTMVDSAVFDVSDIKNATIKY